MPILQVRRLRLREVTLQGSQREEEHGFKPRSLTVALQASLPPGRRVRTCGFLLPPSVTHSVQCPPCLPAPHRPFQAIISPPRMPRLLLTLAAMCSASSSLHAVSEPLQGEGPSPVYLHLSRPGERSSPHKRLNSDLPRSVQESPAEVWVGGSLLQGWGH